ncbi:hypothetical protein MA837_16230 [Salmonella enterica subsp. enterica serovar Kentucky]|uniref:hypothetical protein n=1 Tax=Salmonella enterica TaxID=28901 RepID=UPI001FF47D7A|nr:hypothetical protein [Salmonella enterica]MCJ9772924.1 hypothetical protein [Salmonella enterica subsp. enterica serovar Kentucky]
MKPTYEELEQQVLELAVQLANAESKCSELATELSAVDKIHNEAVFITDDHYEQCPPEVQKMIRSLAVLQIPACDAFLAEVRAQESKRVYESVLDNPAVTDMGSLVDWLEQNANDSVEFAAQLRKGASL